MSSSRPGQLTLFPVVIPALSEAELGAMASRSIPISPDISLPWSENAGPGGWSAKMFLHQMMCILQPLWRPLDTERLLFVQTPLRLQVSAESEISLSDQLMQPGQAKPSSYVSQATLGGIIRRALVRNRSFRVLLRTELDTIPAIVTCLTDDCESWTVRSADDSPGSLQAGLLACLKDALPRSRAMQ